MDVEINKFNLPFGILVRMLKWLCYVQKSNMNSVLYRYVSEIESLKMKNTCFMNALYQNNFHVHTQRSSFESYLIYDII